MSVPVVWQHSYHGAGAVLPASEAASRQSLLAVSGRVLAVCSPGALAVDLLDTCDAADLSGVLGPGRCKMRFIASFPLLDIADAVAVHALCFLQGGLLALAGTCSRGAVIHAYRLSFTSSLGAGESQQHLETRALPQLIFRAALGHLQALGGGPAVPQILAHPRLPGVLAVAVPGDTAVRFYDCSPPAAGTGAGGLAAPLDCSLGALLLPALLPRGAACAAITRIAFSRSGAHLALATAACTLAVFSLATQRPPAAPATLTGTLIAHFACESPATALALLHFPRPPAASRFTRFRNNHIALLTGHANGFLNVWWCGNGAAGSGSTSTSASREEAPLPLASYPPFHASRGPITHISPAFYVDESVPSVPGVTPPALFAGMLAAATGAGASRSARAGTTATATSSSAPFSTPPLRSTMVLVGAHGARGWRCYAFPHQQQQLQQAPQQPPLAPLLLRPDVIPSAPSALAAAQGLASGHWSWNAGTGRREFHATAPVCVTPLTLPPFACPTYADCLRAPVVGWEGGGQGEVGWASALQVSGVGGGGALGAARVASGSVASSVEGGVEPRGVALIHQLPCPEDLEQWAEEEEEEGEEGEGGGAAAGSRWAQRWSQAAGASTASAHADAPVFAGLAPAAFAAEHTLAALCTRGAGFTPAPPSTATSATAAPAAGSPPPPPPAFLPRTLALLLTERQILVCGFDHAPGLASERSAAAVVGQLERSRQARADAQAQAQAQAQPWQLLLQQQQAAAAAAAVVVPVKAPRKPVSPLPKRPDPVAQAAWRLHKRMSYAPPPLPPPHCATAAAATAAAAAPKPTFPMPASGRGDVVIGGRKQLFVAPPMPPPRGGVGAAASTSPLQFSHHHHAQQQQQQQPRLDTTAPTTAALLHHWLSRSTVQASAEAQQREAAEAAAAQQRARARQAYMPRHIKAREQQHQQQSSASASSSSSSSSGSGLGQEEGELAQALATLALREDGFCPQWQVVEGHEAEEDVREWEAEERSVAILQGMAARLGQ